MLNAVVLSNTLYIDTAVRHLAAGGCPVTADLVAGLSPLQYDHINFLGRPSAQGTRPLPDPSAPEDTDHGAA